MAKYGTKASAFMTPVQGAEPIRHPTTGDIIGFQKELIVEAAIHGKEIDVPGPDGQPLRVADIHGHFIDTVQQAKDKGWTDEERERVETKLDFWCEQQPGQIWHLEDTKLPAPWPSYDGQHWQEVLTTARATNLVSEALAYELQREKTRQGIVDGLRAELGQAAEEADAEKSLTVA